MSIRIWLDDVRPAPDGWTWAHTVQEAKDLILHNEVEWMSLDHDLGSGQPTGYDFCCWLEQEVVAGRVELIKKIALHSQNPVGRDRMRTVLYHLMYREEKRGVR